MQLDKLQLALRPRPAPQALDLGYALLRSHAGATYAAWLALWLPLMAVCAVLSFWQQEYYWVYLNLAWWLRALLERAPLYVLSRRVFGENVGWREAVAAWPRQLAGGWFTMLTWRRLFAPARTLYTPIWQLEGARGKVAAERRRVIGRNGTTGAAIWFGICCSFFELVLALGFLAFLSIFIGSDNVINPFRLIGDMMTSKVEGRPAIALTFLAFSFAGGIIGPIFVACGFTLYLNRRATLEAWDIEIALRQIKPPKLHVPEAKAGVLGLLVAGLLALSLAVTPGQADAANATIATQADAAHPCTPPQHIQDLDATRGKPADAEQEKVRRDLTQIYDTDELRGYRCNKHWVWKPDPDTKHDPDQPIKPFNLGLLPDLLKIGFVTLLLGGIAYLAYRFRDSFAGLLKPMARRRATEIAGLDIRPESLPDDVPAEVLALWRRGQQRQALALLYRATISRLAHDDGLVINVGATEGDCSRLAERAAREAALSAGRLKATAMATALWLSAAYAARLPDDDAVSEGCRLWGSEFGPAREGA